MAQGRGLIEVGDKQAVLNAYTGLSIRPSRGPGCEISGTLAFKATHKEWEAADEFEVEISVPADFPDTPPTVKEIGGRIPRVDDYHINPDDTLCLGSTLAIKKGLYHSPTLLAFVDDFVVGYLFNVSVKLRDGGRFVTGELCHGTLGLLLDYQYRFGLTNAKQVVRALELLAMKKRIANKKPCPCNCKLRLGRCKLHAVLNEYRKIAPRSWFARHLSDDFSGPALRNCSQYGRDGSQML